MNSPRWLPLEANPDVMNQFIQQLGLLPSWQFGDVFGMDPELLSLVPRPVCSILLLFPVTEKKEKQKRIRSESMSVSRFFSSAPTAYASAQTPIQTVSNPSSRWYETFKQEEEVKIKAEGQKVNPHVYFMKQTISNACGTIGIIHALANNQDKLEFESHSVMKKFLEDSACLSPEDKAKFLENDESIRVSHEFSAQEGQTEAPSLDEKVDLHFISFVNVDGHLYELDGRKPFPINHGDTTAESLLEDAIEVCKKFMQRDPDELRFTVMALYKV